MAMSPASMLEVARQRHASVHVNTRFGSSIIDTQQRQGSSIRKAHVLSKLQSMGTPGPMVLQRSKSGEEN
jgi:hypothetical protein